MRRQRLFRILITTAQTHQCLGQRWGRQNQLARQRASQL